MQCVFVSVSTCGCMQVVGTVLIREVSYIQGALIKGVPLYLCNWMNPMSII